MQDLKAFFLSLDVDGNGTLSLPELQDGFAAAIGPDSSPPGQSGPQRCLQPSRI